MMSENSSLPRGSSAHSPDLNWSQVRETVLMLELATVQIEAAMKDSHASVDVLAHSFTSMAGYMRTISDTVEALPDDSLIGEAKEKLRGVSEHVASMVHQTIIAFQFYDRLVQRLAHVGIGLEDLANLIGDNSRLFNPAEWVDLQSRIKSKYTRQEEIAMFEAVMHGIPVHEAIDHFMAEMNEKNDDIELF